MGNSTLRKMESRFFFTPEQLTDFLSELAEEIRAGTIQIEGEEVALPDQFEVEYEYKEKTDQSKLDIELKW